MIKLAPSQIREVLYLRIDLDYNFFIKISERRSSVKSVINRYKLLYILLVLLSIASAILMTLFSVQLGKILDKVSGSNGELLLQVALCISAILLWFLCSWCYSYIKSKYVKNIIIDLKKRVLVDYLLREFSEINDNYSSNFLNNVTKNIDIIQENFLIPRITIVTNLTSLSMSVAAILWIEWHLAFVFFALSFLTIFLSQVPGKLMTKATSHYSEQSNHYLAEMTNFIGGFEQIKLLNVQKWIQNLIQKTTSEFEDSRKKYQYRKDLASNAGTFLSFFSQVVCMVAGIFFVRNSLLTVGLLVASIQLLNGVFGPLQSLLYNKNLIKSTDAVLISFQDILDRTHIDASYILDSNITSEITNISINNLKYQVGNRLIFNDFSFEFKKGKRYAIIGSSGVGKSTLAKLILNYFPKNLYDGEIQINGKNNFEIRSKELYNKIAFIQKKDFLFDGSVLDNIKLGREVDMTTQLGKTLGFSQEFISKRMSKEREIVSEGEKQRIDLARFLCKTYSVYIFDEPTSNLDPKTSQNIMDYILSIEDAIVIVITHDHSPEVLERFDQVITL